MAKVDFDDKFLAIVSKRKSEAPRKIKELAVLELYRRKEISSGKAADLLDNEPRRIRTRCPNPKKESGNKLIYNKTLEQRKWQSQITL